MSRRTQAGFSKLVLIIGILVLLLMAMGTTAGLYLGGVIGPGGVAEEQQAEPAPLPALYKELAPAITVNVTNGEARPSVLQARVQVMTRHEEVLEGLETHMPMVRNNLILLFSSQDAQELATREGKEALGRKALEEVNTILEAEGVRGEVEAVYFTSFVMQ